MGKNCYTREQIKSAVKEKGYKWFDDSNNKGYDVNIVGVGNAETGNRVTNRFDEHVADFSKDYVKIKDLALTEKQLKTVKRWMEDKINETYVNINTESNYCNFVYNWKKE